MLFAFEWDATSVCLVITAAGAQALAIIGAIGAVVLGVMNRSGIKEVHGIVNSKNDALQQKVDLLLDQREKSAVKDALRERDKP